jgi:hypothetical protein
MSSCMTGKSTPSLAKSTPFLAKAIDIADLFRSIAVEQLE